MNKSLDYYRELANRARQEINVPAAHKTLFKADVYTEECLKKYYYDQLSKEHGESLVPCANDDVCNYCKRFHLNVPKEIDKSSDIELGNNLEKCFKNYFEEKLNSQGLEIECIRADSENLHMPDFKIVRKCNQKEIAFFEFKVIFRPFIRISTMVDANYQCYSHSQTLDLSNGKKLHEQRKLVEDNIGVSKTVYVYWYDLPCVKGIFWMRAERVYQIMDEQVVYDRKYVAGDYNKGKKIAATKKLYLPLLEMQDFRGLLNHYYELVINP